MQEAQRMKDPLIAQVLLHLALDGVKAGEHVAVGMDNAFGLRGCAGGEKNLQRRIRPQVRLLQRSVKGRGGKRGRKFFEARYRALPVVESRESSDWSPDEQAGLGFRDDALGEIEAAAGIQRNNEHTAQHAAKECGDPLRAVLSPEHDAVAGDDLAPHQFGGKTLCQICEFSVGGNLLAIATMNDHGSLLAMTAVIVDERGQMRAHNAGSMT